MKYATDKVTLHITMPSDTEVVTVKNAPKLNAIGDSSITIKISCITKKINESFPIAVIAFTITP